MIHQWQHVGLCLGLCCVMLLSGCSTEKKPTTPKVKQQQLRNPLSTDNSSFSITNPGQRNASATGIGCGHDLKEARLAAQNVARYNLRSITGNINIRVGYTFLRELSEAESSRFIQSQQKKCLEVQAYLNPGY